MNILFHIKIWKKLESELSISEVIQAGLEYGLNVQGLTISPDPFLDIGTPEGLAQATNFN